MVTKCEHCPLRNRDIFAKMSPDEVKFMQRFKVGELQIDPGTPLLMQGSNSAQLFTALRGMGLRTRLLPDGRRQVINMVFPGDFIGLQAAMMDSMGHSVEATTNMTLCVFDRSEMWTFIKDNPERSFALTWQAAVEEHFLGDALTTIGQRSALEAVAWALAKLFRRGDELGLTINKIMPLPYTQQDLADTLGLSLVHTNRTLKTLRQKQLVTWQDGKLSISDLEELDEIAMTDSQDPPKRPLI